MYVHQQGCFFSRRTAVWQIRCIGVGVHVFGHHAAYRSVLSRNVIIRSVVTSTSFHKGFGVLEQGKPREGLCSSLEDQKDKGFWLPRWPLCTSVISQPAWFENLICAACCKVSQCVQLVWLSFNPPWSAALPLSLVLVRPCAWHSHCLRRLLSTVYLPHSRTHVQLKCSLCPDLDVHMQTRIRWGFVSLDGGEGWGSHRNKKVLGLLCPTNLVTWLKGWWHHVGSIRCLFLKRWAVF